MALHPAPGQDYEALLQFLYLMPVAVLRLVPDGAVDLLNPKAVQLLHDLDFDAGQANGATIMEGLQSGLADLWRASVGRIGPVLSPTLCTLQRPVRGPLHVLVQIVRTDGHFTMLVLEDVTTTVEQERELGRQRRRLGLLLEHIRGYCVIMLDVTGTMVDWNPSIGHLFDFPESEIVGRPILDRLAVGEMHEGTPRQFAEIEQAVSRQGWCRLEAPWETRSGVTLWGDCIVSPVVESNGTTSGYVAVIRDMTEEHSRTEKLKDDALKDPLTGLYNRRGLDLRAAAMLRRAGAGGRLPAWIMVDIDHFKMVNDRYGHDSGDMVLKAVASALHAAARDDDVVARLGGEEFVLLLPGANGQAAGVVAERLRQAVEAMVVDAAGHAIGVTASIGVALQARDEAPSSVLERADSALYRAKREGRNRVVVYDNHTHG
jgi:diguanylate cyclase (GGDEF)-like protein/PAS domain S-box-containing protein